LWFGFGAGVDGGEGQEFWALAGWRLRQGVRRFDEDLEM
jgi:hypothetical protein